ncbi:DUF4254 domain-containing protein [Nocardia sp. 2]|uniref:DUF4254 domain-containing protein n=1 Tax=Nocardia acididurans TaxID=2802282 RepID=A0ABS1MEE6_9NOCA|nr:DUF4254 domain-containing protein [Nocardia acididurans]MBL1078666.1 DUF4254 domain-containing protein [Nocardia acididurans]
MATDYTGAGFGAELPSPSTLLRAFRDPVTIERRDRDVLDSAHELAGCHERRRNALAAAHAADATPQAVVECGHTVEAIDERRTELIARIDDWVAGNIPHHRNGASLHTETLGAVIDRMAAKWVAAQEALGGPTPPARTASKSTDGRAWRRGVSAAQRHIVDSEAHLQWYRLAELADGYRDLITEVAQHRRRLPTW